jgi:hypothetical protein
MSKPAGQRQHDFRSQILKRPSKKGIRSKGELLLTHDQKHPT